MGKKKSNAAARNKAILNDMLWANDVNKRIKFACDSSFSMGFARGVILLLWVLHAQLGFGPKRLQKFVAVYQEYVRSHYSLEAGDGEYQGINIDDMAQALRDECGIDIDPDTGIFRVEKPAFLGDNYGKDKEIAG